LMTAEKDRYADEVIADTRRIQVVTLRANRGALAMQYLIRSRCKSAYRDYGRDYVTEYRVLTAARQRISQLHATCADSGPMPANLNLDQMLNSLDQRFVGAHRQDSALVQTAIQNQANVLATALARQQTINTRRSEIEHFIDSETSDYFQMMGLQSDRTDEYSTWRQELIDSVENIPDDDLLNNYNRVRERAKQKVEWLSQKVTMDANGF
jgi:hypothetical protein